MALIGGRASGSHRLQPLILPCPLAFTVMASRRLDRHNLRGGRRIRP